MKSTLVGDLHFKSSLGPSAALSGPLFGDWIDTRDLVNLSAVVSFQGVVNAPIEISFEQADEDVATTHMPGIWSPLLVKDETCQTPFELVYQFDPAAQDACGNDLYDPAFGFVCHLNLATCGRFVRAHLISGDADMHVLLMGTPKVRGAAFNPGYSDIRSPAC